MKARTAGLVALLLGFVLVVAALVIKLVILPGQAQWPDDVDSTRTYDGMLHVMLDPQALEKMDLANLFLEGIPITNSRHVTTEEAKGDKAIIREVAEMLRPGDQVIQRSDKWYAINRTTMKAVPRADVADFSNSDKIKDRAGLVFSFPIGTQKKEYDGWSDDLQTTLKVSYVREEQRGGLNTYVFESSSSPKEIVDPEMLANFPSALPKDVVTALAQTVDLPDAMRERFAEVLPDLPNPVPLKYTYEYETTYWVEPTSGVLIDYNKHEARKVAFQIEGVPVPVPIMSVFEQTYQTSAASVEDAVDDAKDAKAQIDMFGTTLPLVLVVVGIVLAVIGVLVIRRSRSSSPTQTTALPDVDS